MARHRYRNPVAQFVSTPAGLMLAAGGIYYLIQRGKQGSPASPVQGLGSIFSNFENAAKGAGNVFKDVTELTVRVGLAPLRLLTGTSKSTVEASLKDSFSHAAGA